MATGNRYGTMDIVRYFLAISVIVAHFNVIMGSYHFWPMGSGTAVGIFFGLSGFLVFDSFQKNPDFWTYVRKRAGRILPCYLTIIFSCALLLVLASTYSAKEYFLSATFWKYLLANCSFLNFIEPTLPGVFVGHTTTAVNASLWTLKVEWCLYFCIPLFYWFVRKFSFKVPVVIAVLFVFSVSYSLFMDHLYEKNGNELYHIMSYQFCGQFTYFFTGVLYRHCQSYVHRLALPITIISVLAVILLLVFPHTITNALLFPFFTTVLALIISTEIRIPEKFSKVIGNCSYEMYLIHFPLIQILFDMTHRNGMLTLTGTVIITFILSYLLQRMVNRIR